MPQIGQLPHSYEHVCKQIEMVSDDIIANYQIRQMDLSDNINLFDCGDEDLNDFITHDALLYRRALLATTYILEHIQTKKVIAYFSVANDRFSIGDFPSTTEFNRFRKHKFVNEKRLKSYPAIKICRLGIDRTMQGKQLGTFLIDFISTLFVEDNKSGCRFITVDAYSEAIPFYKKMISLF